ncbi:MAG: 4Fe-4S dicluster domain-containing protein [Bacteroidota bacterium]
MRRARPEFASEIVKYGAKDFKACYNCGTCTAICNLTDKNANFPRMFIRYGVLGQTSDIKQSKELWMCYACGDCSVNCPRQAAPGDYMAAMRRYAIAGFEPTGLTGMIFKSNIFSLFITLFLAFILGFFLMTLKPEMEIARWIFEWLPYAVIHTMGLVIFSFTGLSMVWGLISMTMALSKSVKKDVKQKNGFFKTLSLVGRELTAMKRYRDCDSDEGSFWNDKPWMVRPWFVHWSIMWGFLGLLLATVLDFMLKDPATDMWLPSRLLGTVAGLMMIYGTSLAIYYRIKKIARSYQETKMADWLLLIFLWLAGFTGFWLEAAVFFNLSNMANQVVFMIHTIISMELVLLFSFSKFAHAIYRPLALYFYSRTNVSLKK